MLQPSRRTIAVAFFLLLTLPVLGALASTDGPLASLAADDSRPKATGWDLDRDGNEIADALDLQLADGTEGTLFLHVHYDRKPTESDATLLRNEFGAMRTYVFRNFPWIKVETSYDRVLGLRDAPGVVGIEQFVPPVLMNEVGTRAIRAAPASGVPVVDGKDHTLAVHNLGFRGEGMVIAVLDTGVDNRHESLDDLDDNPATDDPKILRKVDPATGLTLYGGADLSDGFVVKDCIDPLDDESHGTHVAGTALGTGGPTGEFAGVAPQARLIDVDIAVSVPAGTGIGIGEDLAFDWIISFNNGDTCWGDPGADRIDVATMSFGSGGNSATTSQAIGITDVVRSGITFTLAAGNGGEAVGTLGGGSEGAIIVANANDRDTVTRADDRLYGGSSGSSRGPRNSDGDSDTLDEMRPDVAAPGTSIMSAMFHTGNGYWALTGTSMATPHVGGVAALMLQANPGLRPVDLGANLRMGEVGAVPIRDLLQKTAQYKTVAEGTPVQQAATGKFGLPWNNGWGYGLIDAYSAVLLAQQLTLDAPARVQGATNEPLPLAAIVRGGVLPYTVAWTTAGPCTFGNAAAIATDVTCTTAGRYAATLTVTDSAANSVSATVKLVVGDRVTLLTNDVESGSPGWTAPAPGGTQLAPWHTTTAKSTSPSTSWYQGIDAASRYPPTQNVNLLTPAGLDFSDAMAATVSFKIQGDREAGFDFLNVQWHQGAGAFSTSEAISGAFPVFTTKTVDLKGALGNNNVQLRFNAFSDDNTEGEGYYLDDFLVTKLVTPPDAEAPTQVTGLVVSNVGDGAKLSLLWNAADDNDRVSAYRVYRATSSGTLASKTLVGTTASLSFTDTGLTSGTTYYYQIVAVDPSGNAGLASAEASGVPVFVPDTTPPTPPGAFSVADLGRGGALHLTWGAATDDRGIASYVVERDTGAGFLPFATLGVNGRSALDSGLTTGAVVTYRVYAIDTSGNVGAAATAAGVPTTGPSGWPLAHRDAGAAGASDADGWMPDPVVLGPVALGGAINAGPVATSFGGAANEFVVVSDMATAADRIVVTRLRHDTIVDPPFSVVWQTTIPAPATLIAGEPFHPTYGFGRAALGDLTGDGIPDVAVNLNYAEQTPTGAGLNSGSLAVLDGSNGAILARVGLTIGEEAHPAIGDVNRDGMPDVVLIHTVGGTAPGSYVAGYTLAGGSLIGLFDILFSASSAAAGPVLAEMDSNHPGLEVVVADGATSNTAGKVYLCRPFAATANCGTSASITAGIIGLAAADLDGDDRDEIVANGRTGNSLSVVEFTGTALTAVSTAAGFLWNTPVLADIDGDGKLDIANVESSEFANDVAKAGNVRLHGYDGTALAPKGMLARAPPAGASSQSPGGALSVDVDNDGVRDLVYGTGSGRVVAVKLVAGAPVLLWEVATGAADHRGPLAAADIDGDGFVEILAGDSAGKVYVLTHRNLAPVVTAPAAVTAAEAALLSFSVSATDAEGQAVTLSASGLPIGASFTDNGDGTGTFSWTPSHADAGDHVVTFSATDGQDAGSAATTITVDNTNVAPAPSFTLTPTTGVTAATTLRATDTSTDSDGTIASRSWTVSLVSDATPDGVSDTPGVVRTGTGSPFEFKVPDDGEYTITLTVTDNDGGIASTSKPISASNIAPMISSSSPAYARPGVPVTFSDFSSDRDGAIALREWDLNGDGIYEMTTTAKTFTHSFPSQATVTVRHRVTDDDGASATRTMTVIVDGTPPTTTVTAPAAPPSGWYSSKSVTLTVTRADTGGSGLLWTLVTVDGAGSPRSATNAFTVTVSGDGAHVVQYYSKDRAGNVESTQTLVVRIDTTAPSVAIKEPAAANAAAGVHGGVHTVGDVIAISASASDAASGVTSVAFYIDRQLLSTDTDGSNGWTAVWDTAGRNAGSYELRAVATDAAGYTAFSSEAVVLAPSMAPVSIGLGGGFTASNDCDIPVGAACAGGDHVDVSASSEDGPTVNDAPALFGITQGATAAVGYASDGAQGGDVAADAYVDAAGRGCSASASASGAPAAGCAGLPTVVLTVGVVGANDCDITLPTACSGGDSVTLVVGDDLVTVADDLALFRFLQGAGAWLGFLGDGAQGGEGGVVVDASVDGNGCASEPTGAYPTTSCALA